MLAVIFTIIFAALAAAFNITGFLLVVVDITPTLIGAVALLKTLDLL